MGGVSDVVIWIAWVTVGVILSGLLFYWAFFVTEGAYLGARVVAWTYDLFARRYDAIKKFNILDDVAFLSAPMLRMLDKVDSPLVLDVATGTGRMPLALLVVPRFRGYVVGLDLSRKMLTRARVKLAPYEGRYLLVWRDAQRLPFPDETFDAVSCLEALEFMPSPRRLIAEMARVLRPGGVFLITNRINWERVLMPGKAFTTEKLRAVLEEARLVEIVFRPWQTYYDLIWARKAGEQSRLGKGTLAVGAMLHCPHCGGSPLATGLEALRCPACGSEYPLRGPILYMN